MINRINELKNKATERANYYTKIDFPNLANEFTELVNILNEMENIVKEKEELKARVQTLEEKTKTQAAIIESAQVNKDTVIKIGAMMQSNKEEE